MLKPVVIFLAGALLMLLILGSVEWSVNAWNENVKNPQRPQTEQSTPDVVVRSEQNRPTAEANSEQTPNANVDEQTAATLLVDIELDADPATEADSSQQEQAIIEQLLNEDASLNSIIEANVQLLGQVNSEAAFLHHQALLRLVNQTEQVQPMSIVCSNSVCNLAIYATTAALAERFAQQLVSQGAPGVAISGGEYRMFQENEHNFANIILHTEKRQANE